MNETKPYYTKPKLSMGDLSETFFHSDLSVKLKIVVSTPLVRDLLCISDNFNYTF